MIGSVWNRWDIHLHSPATHQNNQFKDITLDEYINKIIDSNISLIAITNYFFFSSRELENIKNKIKEKEKNITVLGNIEFRINQQNKDGEWINIHCIFAEHISTDNINLTLSRFKIINTTKDGRAIYCSNSTFRDESIDISTVTVNFTDLIQHLNSSYKFGTDYLIAICPNGYGGYRPNKTGRSVAVANEIEKLGQVILGRRQDRDFFLNKSYKAKPVFVCSDAHRLSEIGEKYTWVKAKPTFEGLRQALIEPEARVKQTEKFTERTYGKPRFSSVEIGGLIFSGQGIKFKYQKILLNPNMIAIIGGRGTGKSLFLDAMYSKFNHNSGFSSARDVNIEKLEVKLKQEDDTEITFNSTTDTYSYLHVSQGDIKNFTENPDDLSEEIKGMLGISHKTFNSVSENEITDLIEKYRNFVEYSTKIDKKENFVNTSDYQKNILSKYTRLIETLTNPKNKNLINSYQENLTTINNNKIFINEIEENISLINRSLLDINKNISSMNKNPCKLKKISLIKYSETVNMFEINILSWYAQHGRKLMR